MKKNGEYAQASPAHVSSRNKPLMSDVFDQNREQLRQQCEADLERYVGGLRTLRETKYNDDAHDD